MTRLAGLLGDVRAATAFRYDAHDSVGNRMDTAKVIPSPAGGYLAVYHDHEICHLATSTDLMTWNHRAVIDEPATQPTIASTGDGRLLTAVEFNDGHGGQLRVRYWPTLDALLAGRPAREFLAPRTLSVCNEGTPSVGRIGLDTDLDSSWVELGFHYHRDCRVDRQALGTLTGFRAWTAARYRSWTRPWSGPRPRSASRSAATSATGTTYATSAGTTTSSRLRGAGRLRDLADLPPRPGDRDRRTAGGHDPWRQHRVRQPTATMLRDPAGRDALMVTLSANGGGGPRRGRLAAVCRSHRPGRPGRQPSAAASPP